MFFTHITVPKYVIATEIMPILEFTYDYNIWLVQSRFTLNTKCKNQLWIRACASLKMTKSKEESALVLSILIRAAPTTSISILISVSFQLNVSSVVNKGMQTFNLKSHLAMPANVFVLQQCPNLWFPSSESLAHYAFLLSLKRSRGKWNENHILQ